MQKRSVQFYSFEQKSLRVKVYSCNFVLSYTLYAGAKLIAKKYGINFLSSGLLYRYSSYLILKYRPKNKRIDKIVSLISNLKNKDWQDLYLQTKGLRQHNKDLFLNKEKLQEQINKTLIRFLEFADSSQITS